MNRQELSLGERRIGITFKSGNNDEHQNLAERFAHQINNLEDMKKLSIDDADSGDFVRKIAVAQTLVEQAYQMAASALQLHRITQH